MAAAASRLTSERRRFAALKLIVAPLARFNYSFAQSAAILQVQPLRDAHFSAFTGLENDLCDFEQFLA